jgi:uncharacterized protein YndB with AHSA1/START domain
MSIPEKVLLCAALTTSTACATVETEGDGRDVVTTATIPAPPERVLHAFLDTDDLAGWWKVSRSSVDPRIGGTWAVTWDDYGDEKTNHVWTGVIREIGPRRVLIDNVVMVEPGRPLFAPLQLEIVVRPADAGSHLEVVHRGYGYGTDWDWIHAVVVDGWEHVLGDLRDWFAAMDAADVRQPGAVDPAGG